MLEKFKNFGYASFVATLVLVSLGTVAIYSAGHARDPIFHGMWKANLATAAFAFAIYFAAAFFDYRAILKWLPFLRMRRLSFFSSRCFSSARKYTAEGDGSGSSSPARSPNFPR